MTETNQNSDARETTEVEAESTNRRSLLRAAVLGGAGAAVGAVALSKTASAGDSAGTQVDGNATELGETNTSAAPTIIDYTGTDIPADSKGPSVFSAGGYVPSSDPTTGIPFRAGVGGYGDSTVPNGVHGSTTNAAGHGVVAASLAAKAANATTAAPMPALGLVAANTSHVHFIVDPATAVTGPTQGTHLPGELYVDKDGTLWFSLPPATVTTPPSPVRWVKLAGVGTAGSYHAINPARSYDSRKTSYTVSGPLAPNQTREISVADDHNRDSGAVTTANVIPAGATAVMVNVTVSSPTNKNYIAVTAGNVTTTATSLQNWDLGVTQIANSVVVPLSPTRTVRVHMGDQAGSADIIVDVFGYYL